MTDPATPFEAHHNLVDSVRAHVPTMLQAHAFAMLAKESVFKAQDMLYDLPDPAYDKLGKRLAKIRRELELLDNDARRLGCAR